MKERAQPPEPSEYGSGKLTAVAVALFVVDAMLAGLARYAKGRVLLPELIGAVLAPVIFTVAVVAIARLFKRATGSRGAAKVAVGTLAVSSSGTTTPMWSTEGCSPST